MLFLKSSDGLITLVLGDDRGGSSRSLESSKTLAYQPNLGLYNSENTYKGVICFMLTEDMGIRKQFREMGPKAISANVASVNTSMSNARCLVLNRHLVLKLLYNVFPIDMQSENLADENFFKNE
jgi:hypothetical protein